MSVSFGRVLLHSFALQFLSVTMHSILLLSSGLCLIALASPLNLPIQRTSPLNATANTIPPGRWRSPQCPHPVPDVELYPLAQCEIAAQRMIWGSDRTRSYPDPHGIISSGVGKWVSSINEECQITWITPGSYINPPIPVEKERLFLEVKRLIRECMIFRGGYRGQGARSNYESEDPEYRSGELFIALKRMNRGDDVSLQRGRGSTGANSTMVDSS